MTANVAPPTRPGNRLRRSPAWFPTAPWAVLNYILVSALQRHMQLRRRGSLISTRTTTSKRTRPLHGLAPGSIQTMRVAVASAEHSPWRAKNNGPSYLS